MITHEEVREALKEDNMYIVVDYITQQEKVSKLLELYQEREKSRNTVDGFLKGWELTKQIQALEEELK